jgi:uncharacterized protein YycO
MNRQPLSADAIIAKLPRACAIRHPITRQPMLIHAGHPGMYCANARLDVETFNETHGVTAAHIEAMEFGSLIGWDTPGADLDSYIL